MKEYIVQIPTATSAKVVWLPLPAKCTVLGFKVVNDAIPAVAGVITLLSGATTLGTCTVAADAAVGATTNGVMSSTLATRKTPVSDTVALKINSSGAQTTTTAFTVLIMVDDMAMSRD